MTQHSAKRPAVRARWEVSDTFSGAGAFAPAPVCLLSPSTGRSRSRNSVSSWTSRPLLLHEPQPHRRQQLQPGEVPPTLPQPPQPPTELPLRRQVHASSDRRRRPADRAGRLPAARIAAPLLDKVREYQAAEAVTETSHCAYLQKNLREHRFPEHSMPCVRVWCQALSVFASMGGTGASTISCGWLCGLCGCFPADHPADSLCGVPLCLFVPFSDSCIFRTISLKRAITRS